MFPTSGSALAAVPRSPTPTRAKALAPAARRPSRFLVVIVLLSFSFRVVPSRQAPLQRVREMCSRLAAPIYKEVGCRTEQGRQCPCDIDVVSPDTTGERQGGTFSLFVDEPSEIYLDRGVNFARKVFVSRTFAPYREGMHRCVDNVPSRGNSLFEVIGSPFEVL